MDTSSLLNTAGGSNVSTRIPKDAANGATGALFALAVITYACRLYIQLIIFRRFPAEEWLILASFIILVATTALWYVSVNNLYDALLVVLEGVTSDKLLRVLEVIPEESKLANALSTLWWFVIFPVKFAYLVFFRKLIFRLKHLTRYWWFVLIFLFPALIVNEVVAWQTCPYTDASEVISKCSGKEAGRRIVRITAVTTVFDVLSDIFVASIPVALLWRVRISMRQKIGLGLTLCLSLVMAITAIVRISGARLSTGDADLVWVTFWQQQECNIAVMMISLTAFRSFFIRDTDTAMHAQPFLWSKLSIASIRSSLRKRLGSWGSLFRSRRSDRSPAVDSGTTMVQSGGGSGIGVGAEAGPGSTGIIGGNDSSGNGSDGSGGGHSGGGSSGASRDSARSKRPLLGGLRPMREVKIPNGRFSGLFTAIDRAGRTRAASPAGSMV